MWRERILSLAQKLQLECDGTANAPLVCSGESQRRLS